MNARLVNLTPHVVQLKTQERSMVVEPSGMVARVQPIETPRPAMQVGNIEIPVVKRDWGEVEGLPEPQNGVCFLVSSLVLEALKHSPSPRMDVFAPDTGSTALRDSRGQIVGVTRLIGLH